MIPFSYAEVREKRRCKGHNFLMRKCISAINFHICCQILVKMDIRHLHIRTIMLLIIRGLRENRLRVAL